MSKTSSALDFKGFGHAKHTKANELQIRKNDRFVIEGRFEIDQFLTTDSYSEFPDIQVFEWNIPEKKVKLEVEIHFRNFDRGDEPIALHIKNKSGRPVSFTNYEANITNNQGGFLKKRDVHDGDRVKNNEAAEIYICKLAELNEKASEFIEDESVVFFIHAEMKEVKDKVVKQFWEVDSFCQKEVEEGKFNTKLNEDISLKYGDEMGYTDITLKCGQSGIKCHKFILAARSDVFSIMFQDHYEENKTGVVEIEDIDYETMLQFTQYIYTDKLEKRYDMVMKLIEAAEKYNVRGLKAQCEEILIKKMNIENASELLALGDLHNAGTLKEVALDYMTRNKTDVVKTQGWAKLKKTTRGPGLFAEIFERSVMSSDKSSSDSDGD